MGASPRGWVVLAQASVEALWPVGAAAGCREHVCHAVQGCTAAVLGGMEVPASLPGTDGRGRDSYDGGCGLGGDDPLEVLTSYARRHWLAALLVASQWPSGLLVPVAGGDGCLKDIECREHGATSFCPEGVEVAAVDPLTDGRGGDGPCLRRLRGGELVGPYPVLPDATLVDPVPVILRIHLLPTPVDLPPHGLRPVVAGAVEEYLGRGRAGE